MRVKLLRVSTQPVSDRKPRGYVTTDYRRRTLRVWWLGRLSLVLITEAR